MNNNSTDNMKTYNNPTTTIVELDLQESLMQFAGVSLNGEFIGGGNQQSTGGEY